ncbi:hypothetical protein P7K49_012873 [Saguinus oedipus]|uniref:Uncharacterized protein n=1 Tax=Saguinus oedipus TaxID=9490 RepID=A0ABQ9VGE3_SAGOE|nr:hypothetical protein P7K49_012873 [Saguinus oedipus]
MKKRKNEQRKSEASTIENAKEEEREVISRGMNSEGQNHIEDGQTKDGCPQMGDQSDACPATSPEGYFRTSWLRCAHLRICSSEMNHRYALRRSRGTAGGGPHKPRSLLARLRKTTETIPEPLHNQRVRKYREPRAPSRGGDTRDRDRSPD